jgi:hypothetical protein
MPASQIRQIYKPSFSIPVSPAANLNAPYSGPAAPPGPENPGAGYAAPSGGSAETPFNTSEIGPTSMNSTTSGASTYSTSTTTVSPSLPAPLGRVSDSTTAATMATAPPYSTSSGPYATTGGGATVTPLDPGTGRVAGSSSGVTPGISP